MTAKPRVKCTACGSPCKRLIGKGSGIIFRGSGFYETDYKRSGGKDKAEPKTESKAEPKTETKTETTSGTKDSSKASAAAKE